MGTFLKMDTLMCSEAGRKELAEITSSKTSALGALMEDSGPEFKGCTANVMLVKGKKLYVANAGDSRAIVVTSAGSSNLSTDHKPELECERLRIAKAGGVVVNGRVDGNLNLSRSLGDVHYKGNDKLTAEEQMITAMPDATEREITPDVQFVVMGCDGVYETKTTQELGELVGTKLREAPGFHVSAIIEKVLDSLISPNYIQSAGSGCDNMTCIVVQFTHP